VLVEQYLRVRLVEVLRQTAKPQFMVERVVVVAPTQPVQEVEKICMAEVVGPVQTPAMAVLVLLGATQFMVGLVVALVALGLSLLALVVEQQPLLAVLVAVAVFDLLIGNGYDDASFN
jgi:hypothetical protein